MRVPRYWLVSGSAAVPRVAASGVATELSSRMRQRTLSLHWGCSHMRAVGARCRDGATHDARSALQYTGTCGLARRYSSVEEIEQRLTLSDDELERDEDDPSGERRELGSARAERTS